MSVKVLYLKAHRDAARVRERGKIYDEPRHVADALVSGDDPIGVDTESIEDLTKAQIRSVLECLRVDFDSDALKADLVEVAKKKLS